MHACIHTKTQVVLYLRMITIYCMHVRIVAVYANTCNCLYAHEHVWCMLTSKMFMYVCLSIRFMYQWFMCEIMHTHTHTHIHTYTNTPTYYGACLRTCAHTYMHTEWHTNINWYVHTVICSLPAAYHNGISWLVMGYRSIWITWCWLSSVNYVILIIFC